MSADEALEVMKAYSEGPRPSRRMPSPGTCPLGTAGRPSARPTTSRVLDAEVALRNAGAEWCEYTGRHVGEFRKGEEFAAHFSIG